MDKIEAIRFLKYLTHKNINGQSVPDQQHLFQLYPEKGKDLAARSPQRTSLVSSLGDFKKAQDDGYAIGVTVNSIGDWQKRVDENVQYYRAVWHDDDGKGFNGDDLPKDLTPMLILDASGELRKTYAFWEKYRKDLGESLKFLRSPTKTYRGLTIHHWNKGAGKSANNDWKKAPEIAEGVVKAINTEIPVGEEVLVIHHKQGRVKGKPGPDMVKLIREGGLNPNAKVHFLNWGKHTATNDYAHIRHVILAGILQYNDAQNEAIGRGAKRSKTEDEFLEGDLHSVRVGEIAHNIFQAACRGQVRKSDNGDCPEGCHLWIVFPNDRKRGFSPNGLARVFPRAPIVDWEPLGKQLTGKAKETFEFVQSVFVGPTAELKASDVMEHAGMQKANFYKLVDREDLKAALEAEGIELVRPKGLAGYFRKVSSNLLPWELPDTKNAVGF